MAKVISRIIPKGDQFGRLMANSGLVSWSVRGELKADIMPFEIMPGVGTLVPVWKFNFADVIEPEVKRHMIQVVMHQRGIDEAEAIEYLEAGEQAIPQVQVQIEVVAAP